MKWARDLVRVKEAGGGGGGDLGKLFFCYVGVKKEWFGVLFFFVE